MIQEEHLPHLCLWSNLVILIYNKLVLKYCISKLVPLFSFKVSSAKKLTDFTSKGLILKSMLIR